MSKIDKEIMQIGAASVAGVARMLEAGEFKGLEAICRGQNMAQAIFKELTQPTEPVPTVRVPRAFIAQIIKAIRRNTEVQKNLIATLQKWNDILEARKLEAGVEDTEETISPTIH